MGVFHLLLSKIVPTLNGGEGDGGVPSSFVQDCLKINDNIYVALHPQFNENGKYGA